MAVTDDAACSVCSVVTLFFYDGCQNFQGNPVWTRNDDMQNEVGNRNDPPSPQTPLPAESSVSETVCAGMTQSNIAALSLNDLSAISGRGSYFPLIVSSVNVAFGGKSVAGTIMVLFVWAVWGKRCKST